MILILNTDSWWSAVVSVVLLVLLASIPVVGSLLVNRIADRRPSLGRWEKGPRHIGLVIARVGAGSLGLGVLTSVTGVIGVNAAQTEAVQVNWAWVFLVGLFVALGAAALAALGWALSQRAAWVFLALVALLDVEIVLVSLLVELEADSQLSLVVLLAFLTHAVCATVAARWSFTARLHGPVEQAKAGEAGRSIAAVWVFLTAYTLISLITADAGIFGSTAGSAVTGALTLGALGATMGSGYTKYVEALHANGPKVDPVMAIREPTRRKRRPAALTRSGRVRRASS